MRPTWYQTLRFMHEILPSVNRVVVDGIVLGIMRVSGYCTNWAEDSALISKFAGAQPFLVAHDN